jgi:murein tripeptide amidase MpaA
MAQFLRETAIFRIVPMLNVDGVAIGNYRTSLAGYDLNREFISPDKSVFPEVYNIKRLVK